MILVTGAAFFEFSRGGTYRDDQVTGTTAELLGQPSRTFDDWSRSIVVAGTKISDNVNGVAFNSNITVVGHNRFVNVTNPYFRYTPPAP